MAKHWAVPTGLRTRRAMLALPVLLTVISATAHAEVGGAADLSGVTAVQLTVNQTTPDALTCGVDLRQLSPVVSDALQVGGLIVDPASDVTVALTILTGYDADTGVCATTPMLGAYRRVAYYDDAVGWLRSGDVVLWQRGTTATSASADHARAARSAVSELSDALLASWRDANQSGLARR